MKARIAVMVSGGGTNLQALLDAQAAGKLPSGEIVLVIASNSKAYALERAKNAGVPCLSVLWGFRDREQMTEGTYFCETPADLPEAIRKIAATLV